MVSRFLTLRQLASITRWSEWYESKLPLVFVAVCSWSLSDRSDSGFELWQLILILLYTVFTLAFGYAVNDFCDQEDDLVSGKPNAVSAIAPLQAVALLVMLVIAALAVVLPFAGQPWLWTAVTVHLLLGAAYSVPPIRLKERGMTGLLVAATAQRSLPTLVGMAAFGYWRIDAWLFLLIMSLLGLRYILVHQIIDQENDRIAGVSTFVQSRGSSSALRLLKFGVFPLEVVLLISWLTVLSFSRPEMMVLPVVYVLWLAFWHRIGRGRMQLFDWRSYARQPFNDLYMVLLPMFLCLIGAVREPVYLVVLLAYVFWQRTLLTGYLDAAVRLLREN